MLEELQAVNQAIEIVEKYIKEAQNSTISPKKVDKVMAIIEKDFNLPEKKVQRIKEILFSSQTKEAKELNSIDEADSLLLKGLFLKAGMRMSKKVKGAIDFDHNKINFDLFLKALQARKKRLEKNSPKQTIHDSDI